MSQVLNPKKLACPKYWKEGIRELSASDPILAKIIRRNKEIKLYSHQDPFLTLLRAIVSQQISSLAAKNYLQKSYFSFLQRIVLQKETYTTLAMNHSSQHLRLLLKGQAYHKLNTYVSLKQLLVSKTIHNSGKIQIVSQTMRSYQN